MKDPARSRLEHQPICWSLFDPFFVYVLALFLALLPGLLPSGQQGFWSEMLRYVLHGVCLLLLPPGIVRFYYRRSPTALGLVRPQEKKWLLIAIAAGCLLFLLNVALTGLMNAILPSAWVVQQESQRMALQAMGRPERAAVFLVLGLLVPLAEEMLFRSFLYPALRRNLRRRLPALLLTSALFAAAHWNLVAALPVFVGGIGFNLLYERYGSIWYNAVAHMIWNVLALVLLYLMPV